VNELLIGVGDAGSAVEAIFVAAESEKKGIKTLWFADPEGKNGAIPLLKKKGIPFVADSPVEYANAIGWNRINGILVGVSTTATNYQVEATKAFREKGKKVLWLEDLPGSGSASKARSVSPDAMLVSVPLASKIAEDARPGLQTIVINGMPSFGKLPALDEIPTIREKIRNELKLSYTDFLVSVGFMGEPPEMAVSQLEMFLDNPPFDAITRVAWRFHPKHPMAAELFEKAMSASSINSVDARKADLLQLYLASDVVVVGWGGTDGYKALLRGTPVITMLFPMGEEDGRKYGYDDFPNRVAYGHPNGIPPIISKDFVWGAGRTDRIFRLINEVRRDASGIHRYTLNVRAESFRDFENPGAAERAANEVMKFIFP